jgi:hemoglobin-like flavoprotein
MTESVPAVNVTVSHVLSDEVKAEIYNQVNSILFEAVKQVRKDALLDTDLINKTELKKWRKIGDKKLKEFLADGMPQHFHNGKYVYSKKEVEAWILKH